MDDQLKLKTTFDENAELYNSARPHYPQSLFEELFKITKLPANAAVLEIGPGTGQATKPMAEQGYEITAVELGESLANVAKRELQNFPNVHIVNSSFEDIELSNDSFDLVYSATAFHWIRPEFKFKKPYNLLKSDGHLAIIHTVHVSDEGGDKFFEATQPIYQKYNSNNVTKFNLANEDYMLPMTKDLKPAETDTSLFETALFKAFPLVTNYTAQEYIDVVSTYSPTLAMDKPRREAFLYDLKCLIDERFGGTVEKRYAMTLTIAKKI